MRLGLSSDSTRLLVESCAAGGTDSVRMRTNAPLCIGTMSCDLPSCASDAFAPGTSTLARAAPAAHKTQASARGVNLLLIGFTLPDDPDLHLVRGLEVFHVHAREVARRAARARPRARGLRPARARRGERGAWPRARAARVPPALLLDVDEARDDALPHDRHGDELQGRRGVRRVRRLRLDRSY